MNTGMWYREQNILVVTFSVTTKDNQFNISDTMRITVDSPPSISDAVPDTLFVHEDSLETVLYLPDSMTDADNSYEELEIGITAGPNLTQSVRNDSLALKGTLNYFGVTTVKLKVTDPYELSDSLQVPVRVLPVNDGPVLRGLPDITFERNENHALKILNYASDVDGDRLLISWMEPEHFLIETNQSDVIISGTPVYLGVENLVFTVTDPGGLAASDTLLAAVTPATKPPVWSELPKVGFPQSRADSSLVLWDYISDPDDADSLLTFLVSPTEYQIDRSNVNYNNGKLYLYDLDNRPGWDRLSVTAYDPDGNSATTSFLAFVGPLDGTPIVGGIPDTTLVAGTSAQWIDLDDYYYDVDHTDVQMSWSWGRMAGQDSSATISINPSSHVVRLSGIDPEKFGIDKIFFTVTDPDGKKADDICNITVLEDLSQPTLDLPAKIGFVTGASDSLDLDTYVDDALYEKTELGWTWSGNTRVDITLETPVESRTRPVTFTGDAGWTGWERVGFTVINPLGGAAQDTITVFSVPEDGSPLAGGLLSLALTAGECIDVDLDDYFYDADTPEYAMQWDVAGNDSISVTIDPVTHMAHICSFSESWQGTEVLDFTVSDPDGHASSMSVTTLVSGAKLKNVLSAKIFRNPMQEDYMDFFVTSRMDVSKTPEVVIRTGTDSTSVALTRLETNYYTGTYLLPFDASVGVSSVADVIMRGVTTDGKAVVDTTGFAYGRIAASGGRIAFGRIALTVPSGALDRDVPITIVREQCEDSGNKKTAAGEIEFAGERYIVGPSSLIAGSPMEVAFAHEADGTGTCVFMLQDDVWEYIPSENDGRTVTASTSRGGTYRLGFDRVPPRIADAAAVGGGLSIALSDNGAGIDVSTVNVVCGARELPCRFDEETSSVVIAGEDLPMESDEPMLVTVRDRAGNETSRPVTPDFSALPLMVRVGQNTPNPFNPVTTIPVTISAGAHVRITVYDMLGRKVRGLADGFMGAGTHSFVWNARDDEGRTVSSGLYICRVAAGSTNITRKMLFVR